jgi:hypothetical protein
MFDGLKTVLGKAETKGDVAVVLGAGTAGFVVDALATVHGVFSPGTVSALSAAGALSAKKGWEAAREAKRKAKRAEKAAAKALENAKEARARAEKLEKFFAAQQYEEGMRAMSAQLGWREQDIINDEQLNKAVEAARKDFLAWIKKPGPRTDTKPDEPAA